MPATIAAVLASDVIVAITGNRTWEYLKMVIDEDRRSDRKLFG